MLVHDNSKVNWNEIRIFCHQQKDLIFYHKTVKLHSQVLVASIDRECTSMVRIRSTVNFFLDFPFSSQRQLMQPACKHAATLPLLFFPSNQHDVFGILLLHWCFTLVCSVIFSWPLSNSHHLPATSSFFNTPSAVLIITLMLVEFRTAKSYSPSSMCRYTDA